MMLSSYLYIATTSIALFTFVLVNNISSSTPEVNMGTLQPIDFEHGLLQNTAIVTAAQTLLSAFDSSSLKILQFPYNIADNPKAIYFPHPKLPDFNFVGEQFGFSVWSNFPISDVPRPGIRLGEMTSTQHSAAMNLLQLALSDGGFRKVQDIMGSDQVLAESGVPYAAGLAAYTLAILGEPKVDEVWMIQFGGHHLALNIALYQEHALLAPVLTGALPAMYTDRGDEKRVLGEENDKAFALFGSFIEEQRELAIFDHPVSDMVQGPGEVDKTLPNVGIRGSDLSSSQKDLLLELICEWACILNDVHSAPRLAEIRDGLDDTFFAWSGPFTHQDGRNGATYFRIQGPNLFIEFAPQFPGGDLTMHVHTIYRDPRRGYGRTLLQDHRKNP